MSRNQKRILALTTVFALTFGIAQSVGAMHIMEGYLPGGFCIAWGVLCLPFLAAGFFSIKKTLEEHRNLITLLAMSGAFVFVISLFQALLLGHGGLTTIGANTFSMAIAGPFVSWGIYALCKKSGMNKRAGIFLAAAAGDLFTYCVTALQMALAHHADNTIGGALAKFLVVFAPTQVPLAIIEGILTVLIVMGLETYAKPELKAIGFMKEAK